MMPTVTIAAQSSPAFRRLPAAIALVLTLVAAPAAAQQRAARARDTARPVALPAAPAAAPAAASDGGDRVRATAALELFARPDSAAVGTVAAGTGARVTARSGDWVRVQVDAWVRADQVEPAAGGGTVTAAELRAEPEKHVGRTVEWRLQVIGVRRADELRPEMPAGAPYLLTRGPLPEAGFVYVTIPRDQVDRFTALPPLAEVTLRVEVKAARTRYLPTPVAALVGVVSAPGR
jgi:hypothetical protein